VPAADLVGFTPGLDSRPELAEKVDVLIRLLVSPDKEDREQAQAGLIKLGPALRLIIEKLAKDKDPDPERKARIKAILDAYKAWPWKHPDARQPFVLPPEQKDKVATAELSAAGRIAKEQFTVTAPYGKLTIKLSDIYRVRKVGAQRPRPAAEKGMPVIVHLRDGSGVNGTTRPPVIGLRTRRGRLSAPLGLISFVKFGNEPSATAVTFAGGDKLHGVTVEAAKIIIKTIVGETNIPVRDIRSIVVGNYAFSREPGAWTVLRTYHYGKDCVTERVYTDKAFTLDKTRPKSGTAKKLSRDSLRSTPHKLKLLIRSAPHHGLNSKIRKVRYPTGASSYKAFTLDKTTPKSGTAKNLLKEIVYGLNGKIREVRYPTGASYSFDGETWTRTEMGAYLDLPNYQLSPFLARDKHGKIVPIRKVTEGDTTFYRVTLRSPLDGAYKVGTKVGQHISGATYQYAAAGDVRPPRRWTKYEGVIRGESTVSNDGHRFGRGTKYVRIIILPNYQQRGDYRLRCDGLFFSDATKNENLITDQNAKPGLRDPRVRAVGGDGVVNRTCSEVRGDYTLFWTDHITVDSMKAYRISGWFRSAGAAGLSRTYYGVACYNAEKRPIYPVHVRRVKNTFTELAVAAKQGDKVLHLKDASKWRHNVEYVVAAFNVDVTPEGARTKRSTGTYDPVANIWKPDGGESYHFSGEPEPRYVRNKDGTWTNARRPGEKGTYDPIADRWRR